jgi:hypothetical protein
MRLSLAVTYCTERRTFLEYAEPQVNRLIEELRAAWLVVGFDLYSLGYRILEGYTAFDLGSLRTLDMKEKWEGKLKSVGLCDVANATLGTEFSRSDTQRIKWYRQEKIRELAHDCKSTVQMLKLLHEHGLRHRRISYKMPSGRRKIVPVFWGYRKKQRRSNARSTL